MFSFFKKKKIVSHLRLTGVIGNVGKFKQGIEYSSQEEMIKKAFSVKKAEAVAISINSPGGSPVQSHLIYKFIREQSKKNKKKVIVFAEDVAASGGYLIACAGDEIYANASSIIGSIGVIYSSFGFKDLIQKIGDGIGNAEQILREKFGEDVEIKKFEKSKGWLAKKLSSSEDHADKLISVLEERSIWQKYGF